MEEAMQTPSREFLVRQACLNALAGIYQTTLLRFGMGVAATDALHEVAHENSFAPILLGRIRSEYRTLTARFQVAA
jgi:hypothetical protein